MLTEFLNNFDKYFKIGGYITLGIVILWLIAITIHERKDVNELLSILYSTAIGTAVICIIIVFAAAVGFVISKVFSL